MTVLPLGLQLTYLLTPRFFQLLRTKGWHVLQKHVRVRPLRSRLGALHKTTKRWLLSTGTLVPFLLVSGDPVHQLYSWQPFGEKMVTAHGGAGFSALCPPTKQKVTVWPRGATGESFSLPIIKFYYYDKMNLVLRP